MYVRVDVEDVKEEIEGFSFANLAGNTERVKMYSNTVGIKESGGVEALTYYEDIPNLIKALKAAYKHKTGNTL